jgi:hypothetical protein
MQPTRHSVRRPLARSLGFAAAVIGFSACGDDGENAPPTLTYTGVLVDGTNNTPIAGVQICFTNLELACVTTGADGRYSIGGLPVNTKVEAEATKEGYIPILTNFITRDVNFEISAQMFPPAAVELAVLAAGATYDAEAGGLLVRVYDPAISPTAGLAGVSIDTLPNDTDGPYYGDGLAFSAEADATTADGNAIFSALDAGSYALTFSSASHDCPGTFLWKDQAGRVEAKVKAGYVTYLYVDCHAK